MKKEIIRKAYLNKRKSLSDEYIKYSNEKIYENIIKNQHYIKAKTIFVFVSLKKEVDTIKIIEHALKNGKIVGVPLCKPNNEMEVRKIVSFKDLKEGYCKILEPKQTCQIIEKESIDLVLLPCVTADDNCCRIGYGGGFYDRYLANSKLKKIVLVRKKLLSENLTICMDKYDVKCDYIITE